MNHITLPKTFVDSFEGIFVLVTEHQVVYYNQKAKKILPSLKVGLQQQELEQLLQEMEEHSKKQAEEAQSDSQTEGQNSEEETTKDRGYRYHTKEEEPHCIYIIEPVKDVDESVEALLKEVQEQLQVLDNAMEMVVDEIDVELNKAVFQRAMCRVKVLQRNQRLQEIGYISKQERVDILPVLRALEDEVEGLREPGFSLTVKTKEKYAHTAAEARTLRTIFLMMFSCGKGEIITELEIKSGSINVVIHHLGELQEELLILPNVHIFLKSINGSLITFEEVGTKKYYLSFPTWKLDLSLKTDKKPEEPNEQKIDERTYGFHGEELGYPGILLELSNILSLKQYYEQFLD